MSKHLRTTILALIIAGFSTLPAQELSWKNPGNYDYTGHNNSVPSEPNLPEGTPPGFDANLAKPADRRFKVSGMGFLSDGRMVILEWKGFGKQGEIYLVDGMAAGKDGTNPVLIAKDIWEPYGIKVLNDEIFFTAQDGQWKMVRTGTNPEKWEMRSTAKYIIPIKTLGVDFPIAFNTTYANGKFFFGTGAYKNFNIPTKNEGYVVQIDGKTGEQEIIGHGIRMPNGIGVNNVGDVFYGDNQGEYRPSSEIFHVTKNRHYGMAAPDGREGNLGGAMTRFLPLPPADSIAKPAIHIPYRPGSASLTNMFYLEHTPFAGQFLLGDNAFGAVHRIFLEKVKGEYQGAYFQFSGVLEGGIQSLAEGPDGTIYGGTLGIGSNGWSWKGHEDGMMKWKRNGKPFASIISVASQREGFDLQFTEALNATAVNPDFIWVTSYKYEPTSAYGGPKLDVKRMKVVSLRTSADRKSLALSVEGLTAGRVYRIDISPKLMTISGTGLYTRSAWYTLNQISEREVLGTSVANISNMQASQMLPEIANYASKYSIKILEPGPFSIRMLDIKGIEIASKVGHGPDHVDMNQPLSGLHFLSITTKSGKYHQILNSGK